ncbi:BC1872 family protein [Paenibacillus medicaginis]|uniref:Phage ABA sandwich domain-containing protein n=1 Tax=Paenibacillus medicaginis TaxID=1470560 RepID=A0ABV5BUE9_9BACL
MNREEVIQRWDSMTLRERDAWIGDVVMKITPEFDKGLNLDGWKVGPQTWSLSIPCYTKEISAAWEVFINFDTPSVKKNFDVDDEDYYLCKIGGIVEFGKTAPEAICKAALLAVLDI